MAGEDKKTVDDVNDAVLALRETIDKYGIKSPEFKEMNEKIDSIILKDEEANQAMIAKVAAAEKKTLDVEERLAEMELEVAKGSDTPGIDYKELPEYKALNKFAKVGKDGMDPEEFKTMRMDDSTAGGYLTTTEMDSMIIKTIEEISPVRQISRVKTVTSKTLEIPKRTGIPEATYEGEAAPAGESQSVYAGEQLTTYRLTTKVPFTMDLLMDSQFSLENEINGDVAEAFAKKEGNKFVLGTGAKQPEGFLVNAEVVANTRETIGAGVIEGDDLILLTGDLKVGYNPMYGFNRQTLAFLRTLKGEDGHYLWQAGLAPNVPNTLNGESYTIIQDMPVIAEGSLSVVYADFMRGYTITDRTGMVIIRDNITQAGNAIIILVFHRWNTGQVVLSESFKVLETKTS